jgi:hypothetical protein
MPLSRRGFFRGLTGKNEDPQRDLQRRVQAVEAYVRTNLLPYDFPVSGEQTAEALAAAVSGIEIVPDKDPLTPEHCSRIREIVEARVEGWREEHLKAENVRREALLFVREFLSAEARPEDLEALRKRFDSRSSAVFEEEVEWHVQVWLGGVSSAYLATLDGSAVRELVFSELRSWC